MKKPDLELSHATVPLNYHVVPTASSYKSWVSSCLDSAWTPSEIKSFSSEFSHRIILKDLSLKKTLLYMYYIFSSNGFQHWATLLLSALTLSPESRLYVELKKTLRFCFFQFFFVNLLVSLRLKEYGEVSEENASVVFVERSPSCLWSLAILFSPEPTFQCHLTKKNFCLSFEDTIFCQTYSATFFSCWPGREISACCSKTMVNKYIIRTR